jgi:uncharacterized protein
MEVTDALQVPLEASRVREALGDLALMRASLAHCESFTRSAHGEYALALTVPLGALRARYDVRAHSVAQLPPASSRHASTGADPLTLSFKARGEGIGSLRGQLAMTLEADKDDPASTWIDYTVWATASGPLESLSPRQVENALRELAEDFFTEFCEVLRAKHGLPPTVAADAAPARDRVFRRPGVLSAALFRRGAHSRRVLHDEEAVPASGVLRQRLNAGTAERARLHKPGAPFGLPAWAWGAMVAGVALFAFVAERFGFQ